MKTNEEKTEKQNKLSRPAAIIFAVLFIMIIAAFCVINFGFPGLRQYNIAMQYDCIAITASDYPYGDTEVPEDFSGAGGKGVMLWLPKDMEISASDKSQSAFSNKNGSVVLINAPIEYTESDYDLSVVCGISPSDIQSFCESIGRSEPQSYYELLNLIYSLTMDDFNIHSRTSSRVFAELAKLKETFCVEGWIVYRCELNNAVGFIYDTGITGDGSGREFLAELFPKSDGNKEHLISVSATDTETVKQIIASIELVED